MHILKPDHFSQRLILAVICAPLCPIHQPKLNDDTAPFGFWPQETENQFVTPGKQINKWDNISGSWFTPPGSGLFIMDYLCPKTGFSFLKSFDFKVWWKKMWLKSFQSPPNKRVSVLTLEWTKTVFATFMKLAASEGRLKIISFLVTTDCCHGNHSARSVISGHANPDWSKHSLMRCLRRSFTFLLLCSFYFQHLPQCPSLVLLISPLILNK